MTTFANTAAPVSFDVLLAKMMPHFRYFAQRVMRLKADNYDDALAEMTAIAYELYCSLIRRGKPAYYSPIMRYAIKYYKVGRRFMGSNTTDVLSERTQILERCTVNPLSTFDAPNEMDFMLDRRQLDVADTIQWKVDYATWLAKQTPKDRAIIRDLANGLSQSAVARKYGLTSDCIHSYRKRYAESWQDFIADKKEPA